MVIWGDGQEIPFCQACHARLNADEPAPFCSFDELGPELVLRPDARSAAIPEQRDRPEDDSPSGGILRKLWDWVMEE